MARLGRYELGGKIGGGGMAEVFRASSMGPAGFRKMVAVKRLRPGLDDVDGFVTMFLDEARLAALFNHPNIAQVFDVGQEDGCYFLAMELIDGCSLSAFVEQARAQHIEVPHSLYVEIVAQACAGLDYAHTFCRPDDGRPLGVVHRDVSPHNVMVCRNGGIKLVDFGIAKAASNLYRTRANTVKGKLAYMAPEQVLQDPHLDHRADIYSVGASLYRILTGQPPFVRDNDLDTMRAIVEDPLPDPRALSADIDEALAMIILRALAKEPTDRYSSARDMRRDLLDYRTSVAPLLDQAEIADSIVQVLGKTATVELPEPDTESVRREDTETVAFELEEPTAQMVSDVSVEPTKIVAQQPARFPRIAVGIATVSVAVGASLFALLGESGQPSSKVTASPRVTANETSVVAESASKKLAASETPTVVESEPKGATQSEPPRATQSESHEATVRRAGEPEVVAAVETAKKRAKEPVKARRPRRKPLIDRNPLADSDNPPTGTGDLHVDTQPWAEILVDGKRLGTTPLDAPLELPVGRHRVRLHNPELDVTHAEQVVVRPGERTLLRKQFGRSALVFEVGQCEQMWLDGAERGGMGPGHRLEVWEGRHTVAVRCGAKSGRLTFRVSPRAQHVLRWRGEKLSSSQK